MVTEARPRPEDYSAIAEIARDMLKAADPSDAFDPTDILNKIQAGQRSMVLRESGWQSVHSDPSTTDDDESVVVGWAIAQDRAAGRVNGLWSVQRGNDHYIALAARALAWLESSTREILEARGLESSIIVTEVGAKDLERVEAIQDAGFEKARTWIIMEREVTGADADVPARPGVTVRPILTLEDRREAHRVLEESFQDHFNNFPESFEEFEPRIELFPGHDWARDFVAEVDIDGKPRVVGALINGWLPTSNTAAIEYAGVSAEARGMGVAKALFQAVLREAAELGYTRAELVVDADSPTGAQDAYVKMGFTEDFRTQSWHKTITRR